MNQDEKFSFSNTDKKLANVFIFFFLLYKIAEGSTVPPGTSRKQLIIVPTDQAQPAAPSSSAPETFLPSSPRLQAP
jgi:hypothetical protein